MNILHVSNCCAKPMFTEHGDEGTNFYRCTGCMRPCDPLSETDLKPMENKDLLEQAKHILKHVGSTPALKDKVWYEDALEFVMREINSHTQRRLDEVLGEIGSKAILSNPVHFHSDGQYVKLNNITRIINSYKSSKQ